jgi:hypothetical protein
MAAHARADINHHAFGVCDEWKKRGAGNGPAQSLKLWACCLNQFMLLV